jgi:molybdenum cofactor cytidylyltransferase
MKFGRTILAEADGAILAHGIRTDAISLKKGRKLTAADIAELRAAGVESVIAARLEPGDVPEDLAAHRIALAIRGPNADVSAAFTGRANLHATARGLVLIDVPRINAINAIHESITVATLAPFEVVEPRQMVATVKVIPFAAPEWAVTEAEEVARKADGGGAAVQVAGFTPKKVALISTTIAVKKPSLLDKNRAVLVARLEALGSMLVSEYRCAHEAAAVAAATGRCMRARPDMVFVFGASATTDRLDAVPSGIVSAGGVIEHFGMPVDPGNLLLLARLGSTPVIGLPGCARSPKINGFDWVLQRLCADIPVAPRDLASMGVGGLLKEIPTRPQPREPLAPSPRLAPSIAAVVLAAGRSTRMGGANKLLMDLHGRPMVARTVEAVAESSARPIIVVTGHERAAVEDALRGNTVGLVHNPRFAEGLSTSLKAGLAALPADVAGALICLGDMPAVGVGVYAKLIAAFDPVEGRSIVVPLFQGKRGNPVLFAREHFDEIMRLEGDAGARALLSTQPESVCEVEVEDAGVLADADTPAAFAAIKAHFGP